MLSLKRRRLIFIVRLKTDLRKFEVQKSVMESITLTSNSKSALKAIKAIAKEMPNISISEKTEEDDGSSDFYIKGVKVRKPKGKLDIDKLSGSFPNMDMDPKTFRKKLWSRQKA